MIPPTDSKPVTAENSKPKSFPRRIVEAVIVFTVFEVVGVAGVVVHDRIAGGTLENPDTAAVLISFGIAGLISWELLCYRNSSRWLRSGVVAGVLFFPITMVSFVVDDLFSVHGLRALSFDSLMEIVFSWILVPIYGIFIIPPGLLGAFACHKILGLRPPVSSENETEP